MKYVESDEDVITVRKFIDKRATDLISEAESEDEISDDEDMEIEDN